MICKKGEQVLRRGEGVLLAQVNSGTIYGKINDQSRALIVGAVVTVGHSETGIVREKMRGIYA